MKEIFEKSATTFICSSILALIVGIIFVIKPDLSLSTIGIIASCYIIFNGVLLIVLDLKASKYFMPFDGLFPGILSVILGVILLCNPEILTNTFGIIMGIWIIISCINSIRVAFAIKGKSPLWILLFIIGILDLIVGLFVVFNPFASMITATLYVGIMIIIHSIINIIDMIILKKNVNAISETIEKSMKEAQ